MKWSDEVNDTIQYNYCILTFSHNVANPWFFFYTEKHLYTNISFSALPNWLTWISNSWEDRRKFCWPPIYHFQCMKTSSKLTNYMISESLWNIQSVRRMHALHILWCSNSFDQVLNSVTNRRSVLTNDEPWIFYSITYIQWSNVSAERHAMWHWTGSGSAGSCWPQTTSRRLDLSGLRWAASLQ